MDGSGGGCIHLNAIQIDYMIIIMRVQIMIAVYSTIVKLFLHLLTHWLMVVTLQLAN